MINKYYTRLKLYSTTLLLCLLVCISCTDVLEEVDDLGNYPEEGTFDDVQTTQAYLAALYASTLPSWPVNEGNYADESGGIIGPDWITPTNGTFKYWPYDVVRRINILLQELPLGAVEEDDKAPIMAQARFLRAFLYFRMLSFYGGIPIITEPQLLEDDLNVKRNTSKECFDFIVEELDAAIAALPNQYDGEDRGKIDKASALAYKARVLLYKASPQFNPDNPYTNQYWAEAYAANKEAKDFLDANGYGLLENYVDVFETEGHQENILSVLYKEPVKTNGRREDSVRPLSESKNATGGDQPIWALAEAYPMLDGKQPGSSSKYSYDLQTFWQNRDPRFSANLVWNGSLYELSGKSGRRQYTIPNIALSVDAFGYVVQGESHYRTGLFCRKGIMEQLSPELVNTNDLDWPEIRYAEVLFNYAEASNETNKPQEAVQVLKDIRARAGIEPGTNAMYGLKENMSREEIREAILHEKYLEMAFEGHRFWDLRRHRMLDKLDGIRKHGIMAVKVNGHSPEEVSPEDISLANANQLLPQDFEYEVAELITNGPKVMVMDERYYFFPIGLNHIDTNPKLEQSLGWEGGTFDPTL